MRSCLRPVKGRHVAVSRARLPCNRPQTRASSMVERPMSAGRAACCQRRAMATGRQFDSALESHVPFENRPAVVSWLEWARSLRRQEPRSAVDAGAPAQTTNHHGQCMGCQAATSDALGLRTQIWSPHLRQPPAAHQIPPGALSPYCAVLETSSPPSPRLRYCP
ncbi:hypothetical protein K458DRAFT_185156 [Lentithecium fluviatile CBS 122367]|uniref:Uncharacterized protein n=1 Tax=Lentithecium fluviatile CBS 122367 TaxID=1168545 RepID=A0A6G1JA65_9PLEO|nr:hypothetical protein K458DRAFT_185156 [Lentithecium fluviatile CBS 122367]